jgi:hypothetical protein
MPGPVPGIHVLNSKKQEDVDGRDTPGTKCPGAAMTQTGYATPCCLNQACSLDQPSFACSGR